jgi:hypothetical protein
VARLRLFLLSVMKAGESFSRRKDFSLVYHSQEQRIKYIAFM